MQKINLVKAIVRYRSSVSPAQRFVYGDGKRENSTRYLLLRKAKDPNPKNNGKWECSGGLIDPGESSRETIEREVKEETGLAFRVVKQLPTLESDKSVCDVYLIDASSMDVILSSEHSDYQWFKAEDVQKQDLVAYADLLLEFFNNPEKYFN